MVSENETTHYFVSYTKNCDIGQKLHRCECEYTMNRKGDAKTGSNDSGKAKVKNREVEEKKILRDVKAYMKKECK